jgi:hypothetical protein
LSIVKYLCEIGTKINAANKNGVTALFIGIKEID